MALNVERDPVVRALRAELEGLSSDPGLDNFFWLKAIQQDDGSLKFFRGAAPKQDASTNGTEPALARQAFRVANIVLQGGGTLGIAHAGFVAGLEIAGVRFAGIAGASAGAIMAMGMAAVRGKNLSEPTHVKLLGILSGMPMATFIDGPFRTRRLIKQLLLKRISFHPSVIAAALGALRQILRKRGLNPGNAFEDWLRGVFAEHGLRTVDDLNAMIGAIAEALNKAAEQDRDVVFGQTWDLGPDGADLLQVMAACVPIGVKFQFPRDAQVLSASTMTNSPAALVRASMSIPLFFEPAFFDVDKKKWAKFVKEHLEDFADKQQLNQLSSVSEVAFLDGGIFSNLPLDAFTIALPFVPTIAVPLISASLAKPYKRRARLSSLAEEIGTIAFTVKSQRDRDALDQLRRQKLDFKRRREAIGDRAKDMLPPTHPFHTAPINIGDANWLNFVMNEQDMTDLFVRGMSRAKDLLIGIIQRADRP